MEAIREAVYSRARTIFISTMTVLPLVIFPGAGSELYRGLGSVVPLAKDPGGRLLFQIRQQ